MMREYRKAKYSKITRQEDRTIHQASPRKLMSLYNRKKKKARRSIMNQQRSRFFPNKFHTVKTMRPKIDITVLVNIVLETGSTLR
jgi:predicted transcriptional regulator